MVVLKGIAEADYEGVVDCLFKEFTLCLAVSFELLVLEARFSDHLHCESFLSTFMHYLIHFTKTPFTQQLLYFKVIYI